MPLQKACGEDFNFEIASRLLQSNDAFGPDRHALLLLTRIHHKTPSQSMN